MDETGSSTTCLPLLLRKDGKPRKRQPPMEFWCNGKVLFIARGVEVSLPWWVEEIIRNTVYRSSRTTEKSAGGR